MMEMMKIDMQDLRPTVRRTNVPKRGTEGYVTASAGMLFSSTAPPRLLASARQDDQTRTGCLAEI